MRRNEWRSDRPHARCRRPPRSVAPVGTHTPSTLTTAPVLAFLLLLLCPDLGLHAREPDNEEGDCMSVL